MDLLTYLENRQNIYTQDLHRLYELQMSAPQQICVTSEKCSDVYGHIRRLAMVPVVQCPKPNSEKRLTSFRICDILSNGNEESSHERDCNDGNARDRYDTTKHIQKEMHSASYTNIRSASEDSNKVEDNRFSPDRHIKRSSRCRTARRPWSRSPGDDRPDSVRAVIHNCDSDSEQEIDVEACDDDTDQRLCPYDSSSALSPLDALVQMSKATFRGLDNMEAQRRTDPSMTNKSQMAKKKRKTRTAFTNQQIYELEKRFLYQKYLTPADRDDISQNLGLTCAQVITWFQNRRAKFKRDIEELKNDVGASSPGTPKSC